MKYIANSMSRERIVWCALLTIIVFAGILRYGLLSIPLQRDEGEYAYAAQLILQGVPPYEEVYTMKLPGAYAAYAMLLSVFGQTAAGIHTGLLIINAITIIAVFLLAKQFMNSLSSVVSAASFALLSVSQPAQGVFLNAEHFVILFATIGLCVMLRALAGTSMSMLFAAGLLLGICFTMKQHGIAFIAFAGLYIVFNSSIQRPFQYRGLALNLLSFGSGVITVFTFLLIIIALSGVFKSFWFWTVDYAQAYISLVHPEQAWQNFIGSAAPIVKSAPLLWALISFGLFALMSKRTVKHHRVFLVLYVFFSLLSICPGFYFRPHYFLLLLPCSSLLAGMAISILMDFLSRFSFKIMKIGIPITLSVVCASQLIYQQYDYLFSMTPFQVTRSTYGPNPFFESVQIAEFIRQRTNKDDHVAILGSEPQIYFYSKRRSASGYVYMYPLMENHDFALQMQKDFIKDVETKKPKYLVFVNVFTSWLRRQDSNLMVFDWFNNYQEKYFRQVGLIELFPERALYHWEPHTKWPASSEFWVAVFERVT